LEEALAHGFHAKEPERRDSTPVDRHHHLQLQSGRKLLDLPGPELALLLAGEVIFAAAHRGTIGCIFVTVETAT
jgi:hypothetical protein